MPSAIPLPESFGLALAELRDALDDLQRRDRLTNASIAGGTLTGLNAAGEHVVLFGAIGDYGFGLFVANVTDNPLLIVSDEGWSFPQVVSPWRKVTDSVTVTSGTYTTTYRTNIASILGDTLIVEGVITTAAGTTADVRVTAAGVEISDALSIPANTSQAYSFKWLHGIALTAGPIQVDVEVRRTGGAGNVTVFEPDPCRHASHVTGATAGGL